jgi:hypothetical protein
MTTLADWIRKHTEDYKQLADAYPNANKFAGALKNNVSKNIPSNEDFRSPEKMSEWSQAAALNAPMLGMVGKLPATEFSKAHDIARINAALPVEQGGLGLHPDNTAMERARAMGYEPTYHGTGSGDIIGNELIPGGANGAARTGDAYGFGVYTTDSPGTAGAYTKGESPAILPLMVNREKYLNIDSPTPEDYQTLSKHAGETMLPSDRARFDAGQKTKEFKDLQEARDFYQQRKEDWKQFGDGYERAKPKAFLGDNFGDGPIPKVEYTDFTGDFPITNPEDAFTLMRSTGWDNIPSMGYEGHTMLNRGSETWDITRDTKNLRSRFAAFDPLKKNSANILAGTAAGSVILNDKKKKLKDMK